MNCDFVQKIRMYLFCSNENIRYINVSFNYTSFKYNVVFIIILKVYTKDELYETSCVGPPTLDHAVLEYHSSTMSQSVLIPRRTGEPVDPQ